MHMSSVYLVVITPIPTLFKGTAMSSHDRLLLSSNPETVLRSTCLGFGCDLRSHGPISAQLALNRMSVKSGGVDLFVPPFC